MGAPSFTRTGDYPHRGLEPLWPNRTRLWFGSSAAGPGRGEEFAVKRKRLSVEQIVAALKQIGLGMTVAEASRQLGVSEQAT